MEHGPQLRLHWCSHGNWGEPERAPHLREGTLPLSVCVYIYIYVYMYICAVRHAV